MSSTSYPPYVTVDASGNETIAGSESIGATGTYGWTGRAKLASPADGFIQPQTSAGATTDVTTCFLLGPNNATGVRIFKNGSAYAQAGVGDLSANATWAAKLFESLNDTGAPNYRASYQTTYGLYINNAGPYVALQAGGINTLKSTATLLTATVPMQGQRNVVLKTSSYSVVAGDSGNVFQNTGAAGQVAYTLPAAAAGLHFTFINTAAGATFSQAVAVAADKIACNGVLGAAAGSITSSAIWTSFTLVGYTAQWVATEVVGTPVVL